MEAIGIQISNEIEKRLFNISKNNGYANDIRKIERASTGQLGGASLPAINFHPLADSIIERFNGGQVRELEILVEFYDKERDRAFTDRAFEAASDIQIALWRSTEEPNVEDKPNANLGGLTEDLFIESMQPAIGEGQKPIFGCVLTLKIQYRVKNHSPFELI